MTTSPRPPEEIRRDGRLGWMTVLADGRVIACYMEDETFENVGAEQPEQWLLLRESRDHGRTWGPERRAFAYPAGKGKVSAGLPFTDRAGHLHVFGLRFTAIGWRGGGDWKSTLEHTKSTDGGQTWQPVKTVDFGHDYTGSYNCVMQMDNGRILFPLSFLDTARQNGKFVGIVVYSDDGGATWGRSNELAIDNGGQYIESGAVEPVVVQFPSGMLWMLIRTQTGYFWESFSNDGAIWTPPQITRIVASNAPAGLVRLADGRIVMFWNNLYGEPFHDGISYLRNTLHGAISTDEAQTWSVPKIITRQRPEEDWKMHVRYPIPVQAHDGTILVPYHRVVPPKEEGKRWTLTSELVRVDPAWLAAR